MALEKNATEELTQVFPENRSSGNCRDQEEDGGVGRASPAQHPQILLSTPGFPKDHENITVPLTGLYLDQGLAGLAAQNGGSLVFSNFLTDRNGVIAKIDENHKFQVPLELRNASDWRLFQELMAQADIVISGEAYIKRVSLPGNQAEDILSQFEPAGEFEELGEWRLRNGFQKRSPDLAILSRHLDLEIPPGLRTPGRSTLVFTTDGMANSERALELASAGFKVIGSGAAGVSGERMIDTLKELGYHVVMMATGPSVLKLLLDAKRLDLLFVTEAQMEIPFVDPASVKTILPGGQKMDHLAGFRLAQRYTQENVLTQAGTRISQDFLRFERKGFQTTTDHRACLLLGSNIQPAKNLALGLEMLCREVNVLRVSSVWQTSAVGSAGPDFLNLAVLVTTRLEMNNLKEEVLRGLETRLGRRRSADKNAARPIDIDILLFDDEIVDPDLFRYAFRAVPVAELLPDLRSASGELLKEAAARLASTAAIIQVPEGLGRLA